MQNTVDISFVIPCYRSEKTILIVVDEIEETMKQRPELTYEVILVNDGSPDNVWEVIEKRTKEDEHVVGVNLAKNFGQHCALMAGYNQTTGEIVVSLDDDGQTPANEVFSLVDKLKEGFDVVYASYPVYHQTWFRRWGSNFSRRVGDFMLDIKGDYPSGSSYFVMRRFVRDEIIRYDHPYPFVSGLISRATTNIGFVFVDHRERLMGHSGYTLKKLIKHWTNSFTAFSVKRLEMGAFVGFFCAAAGFIFALVTVILKLVYPYRQAGWSSTISALMIIGGVIMIMLGIIGEYIGRIYICLNNSPQYVVKEIASKEERLKTWEHK